MRITIRKVGPTEVVFVTRVQARILNELRFTSLSIGQIAARLELCENDVDHQIRKFKKQLKARNRADIVLWWKRQRVKHKT